MKRILFILAAIMTAGICHAQEDTDIYSSGRAGQTFDAVVVPQHKIMWENGLAFEKCHDGARTLSLNSTLLRYGLFKNVEIFAGTDFLMFADGQDADYTFGVNPLYVGTKMELCEGSGIMPSIALVAELTSPHIGSRELLPSHLAPSLYVVFDHEVNDWLELYYNIGAEWDGETAVPQTFLALALAFGITDNIGAFVESCNYLHTEDGNQYMTGIGFTWTLSRSLMLDLECSMDLQHLGSYYAIGGGLSWIINR